MEDSRIIELYFQRSEEAITETAAKYGSYCFSIARNILADREDAEEAVNDTYLATWRAIPPHNPRSLSAFLGKITRRISLTRWEANHAAKRGGGEAALALEELAGCIPVPGSVEQHMEAAELTQLLNRFLRTLPDTQRRVFIRRYWHLDSISAIARQFGFSESKVKSMLLRTRNKLHFQLQKEGYFV